MNNTVGIKSVLTGVFLILTFVPALEVRAFGQSAVRGSVATTKTASVTSARIAIGAVAGNQIGDEAIATEDLATVAVVTGAGVSSEIADRTSKPRGYVCEDCCGPKFYQSELWSNPFGRAFSNWSSAVHTGSGKYLEHSGK